MPIVPIRDLGIAGVRTDTDPYDNEIHAFTMAVNARFEDKRIQRGPVFSISGTLAANASPRFAMSYKQLTNVNQFHVANKDGTVTNWASAGLGAPSTETTISPVAWTLSDYDQPYTATTIQDVVYLNRADRVPWFKPKNSSLFAEMPNAGGIGWDSTWRCAAIREVAGVVVALNITKGGVAFPTMVKTSDYPTFGNAPAEWVGSTTNSASEQIIADLSEPLTDGLALRDRLILYTENECWSMEPRADSLMFNYRRLFSKDTSSGIISQNCAAEYNNTHYVFGTTDIWTHDGFQRSTLAAGLVRDFVYNNMDKSQSNLFFVQHNPRITEMMFCYVSNDPFCRFPAPQGTGCNRAAVWNYRSKTWYFYDLPYCIGGALGTPFSGSTYADMGILTYDDVGGSYASFGDTSKLTLLMVGTPATGNFGSLTCAVRAFDRVLQSSGNGVLDRVASGPVYIELTGIDLDNIHPELRGYKVVKGIYPEGRISPGTGSLMFYFSVKDYAGSPQNPYDDPQAYDGNSLYKLDFRAPGRFLDMKITYDGYENFSLSGLDFDFVNTGSR